MSQLHQYMFAILKLIINEYYKYLLDLSFFPLLFLNKLFILFIPSGCILVLIFHILSKFSFLKKKKEKKKVKNW